MPACEPEVAEYLLRRLRPLLEPGAEVRDAAERVPDPCESGVVFCMFEERKCRPCESLKLVDVRVVREEKARLGGDDEGECLPDAVAGLARPLGGPLGDRRPLARHLPRVREIELEADIETERPRQLQRPLEQRRGRPIVAPPERAPARIGKTRAS